MSNKIVIDEGKTAGATIVEIFWFEAKYVFAFSKW